MAKTGSFTSRREICLWLERDLSAVKYRIYSLIRCTIFAEKICLFDQNLLKTRGVSYNRVFSRNKI